MRSRVMPDSLVTMERRVPVKRLKSVDLPTLGRPTMTRDGRRSAMSSWAGPTVDAAACCAIFQCSAFRVALVGKWVVICGQWSVKRKTGINAEGRRGHRVHRGGTQGCIETATCGELRGKLASHAAPLPSGLGFLTQSAETLENKRVGFLMSAKRCRRVGKNPTRLRSEEHTSELQSRQYLVCRLLLEKKTGDQEV